MRVAEPGPPSASEQADPSRLKVWVERISLQGGSQILPAKDGVTAIVGANNVGKTTLLNELNTLLSHQHLRYGAQAFKLLDPVEIFQRSGSRDDLLAWLHENAQWGRDQNNPSSPPGFNRQGKVLRLDVIDAWLPDVPLAADPFWVQSFSAGNFGSGFQGGRSPVGDPPTEPIQVLYEQPTVMQRLSEICLEVFGFPLTLDDESPAFQLLVGRPDVPRPPHGSDLRDYRESLSRLEPLSSQGHGVTAFMSIITQLVTGAQAVILADEPEAFLHPPQARALGRHLAALAAVSGSQLILATHDRNLLAGLLDSEEPLSVVRLVRTDERTLANQLHENAVRDLWADPVLRYSDVLDGLFHKSVLIAEGHRDCTFYRAAAEYRSNAAAATGEETLANPSSLLRVSDIMFMPSNGKQAIPRLINALAAVRVPVIIVPDLDVLSLSDGLLEKLVVAAGGSWSDFELMARAAIAPLSQPTALNRVGIVRAALNETLDELLKEDPDAVWDKDAKRRVGSILRATAGVSETLKKQGVSYATGETRRSLNSLITALHNIGVVPVEVGELERFGPDLNQNKATWLEEALASGAHKNASAQTHIAHCIAAAEAQLLRPSLTVLAQHATASHSS